MDRLIFIVRADRLDLFEALKTAFAREHDVEVVLERRSGLNRRPQELPHAGDRRGVDRRARPAVDAEIRERGWSLVRRAL
ncbi:MAG TPA: hypothetical protein VIE37_04520 [Methylomirabilota bacterium]|jgi:hypothetical protein